jgi:uncharacterized protein (UPF0332 family)
VTPEQEQLVARARRSIRSAKLVLADGDCNTAVSRAYYAMFYLAEAFLLEKGLGFSKHSAVIAAFGKEFANTGKVPSQYHLFLRKAAQDRVVGDYEFTSSLTKEQADLHISRAEDFPSMAEPLLRN